MRSPLDGRAPAGRRRFRQAFTLIELLVVMTIIGILLGPSVARRASRGGQRAAAPPAPTTSTRDWPWRASAMRPPWASFLPGGWFYRWAGDPNQGFTKIQPGSWLFNILPWIDAALHDQGKGMGMNPPQYAWDNTGSNQQRLVLGAQVAATPVAMLLLPSRRPAKALCVFGRGWLRQQLGFLQHRCPECPK